MSGQIPAKIELALIHAALLPLKYGKCGVERGNVNPAHLSLIRHRLCCPEGHAELSKRQPAIP